MKNDITLVRKNNVIGYAGLWCMEYRYADIVCKDLLDEMIDEMILDIPDARTMVISPQTHKWTGIDNYEYRNLKVEIDPCCPNPTIYLKK
jgi:hypothetical protein